MSDELPPGWTSAKVRDLGLVQLGRQRSPDVHRGSNMRPYLRVANVFEDRIDLSDVMEMHFEQHEIPRFELKSGDILLNEGQSRELVGRPAMYRGELPGACFTNSLIRFQAGDALDRNFALQTFRHWLRRGDFQRVGQITTNIAHLGAGRFAEMEFALPPLNEQRRIVAKLEALQARSRRAREALEAVPPLLEKLRQSILAAAFRGDLTKDWRAKHPEVEPASELLRRIRVERRKKWEEAELGKMRAKGKVPGDDRWKEKYKEPAPVDASGLPELPEGWCWASVEELALVGGGLTKNAAQRSEGVAVPLISVAAVQLRQIRVDDISSIRASSDDGDTGTMVRGDLLIVEGNGSLSHIGRVAIWNDEVPGARHQNHIIRVRPMLLSSEYLLEWLASPLGRAVIVRRATSATGLYTLSISKVEELPVPVAPAEEARAIGVSLAAAVRRLQTMTEFAGVRRAGLTALEQSILAKAFRGGLVVQDPRDEPAAATLARVIAATGLASESRPKAGRTSKRKTG